MLATNSHQTPQVSHTCTSHPTYPHRNLKRVQSRSPTACVLPHAPHRQHRHCTTCKNKWSILVNVKAWRGGRGAKRWIQHSQHHANPNDSRWMVPPAKGISLVCHRRSHRTTTPLCVVSRTINTTPPIPTQAARHSPTKLEHTRQAGNCAPPANNTAGHERQCHNLKPT
jgi:hypothetical protein